MPEEIRGAFKTVAAAFGIYADALGGIHMSLPLDTRSGHAGESGRGSEVARQREAHRGDREIEAWAKNNARGGKPMRGGCV